MIIEKYLIWIPLIYYVLSAPLFTIFYKIDNKEKYRFTRVISWINFPLASICFLLSRPLYYFSLGFVRSLWFRDLITKDCLKEDYQYNIMLHVFLLCTNLLLFVVYLCYLVAWYIVYV